jgi:hypothetical protein
MEFGIKHTSIRASDDSGTRGFTSTRQSHSALWFLPFMLLAVLIVSCSKPATLSPTATPALAPAAALTPAPVSLLPLIDAHNHLPRGVSIEQLIKVLDDAGVRATMLMTVYYGGNNAQGQGISDENLVLEFYKKQPNRIIPILGMQRPVLLSGDRWAFPDGAAEKLLTFTESKLQTKLFRGMGEFILWHYPYAFPSGPTGGTVKIPADTPLMKRFLDLAAKYLVPVTLHYEIENESFPALKNMLEYGRKCTIVLAHNGGRPDPPTLATILNEYPNLFCDLGGMTRFGAYGRVSGGAGQYTVKNPIDDGTGHLRPQWKRLYEQYPDRFMIGTDFAHPEPWGVPGNYKRQIDSFRSLLSDLSPATAEKIGFRNAQNLFSMRSF